MACRKLIVFNCWVIVLLKLGDKIEMLEEENGMFEYGEKRAEKVESGKWRVESGERKVERGKSGRGKRGRRAEGRGQNILD